MRPDSGCEITLGKVSRADRKVTLSGNTALHEDLEIKCFYEGTATLLIESQTVSVKAGDVVVINPYEFHATVDTGEETGKYHLFMLPLDYFSGEPALDLHKLFFGEEKRFLTLFSGNRQLYDLLMQAAEESRQKKEMGDLMIKSLLMTFFALLLRHGVIRSENSLPEKSELRLYSVIEPALQCIKNEYRRPLTVDELAKKCNVSKHYFCRVFKAVTEKSAMEYLRDYRLRIADVLLSNTKDSVAEIAARCGFENPNYFSRCYKQRYGESPRRSRCASGENTGWEG